MTSFYQNEFRKLSQKIIKIPQLIQINPNHNNIKNFEKNFQLPNDHIDSIRIWNYQIDGISKKKDSGLSPKHTINK